MFLPLPVPDVNDFLDIPYTPPPPSVTPEIVKAAYEGDLAALKELVKSGHSVNTQNDKNYAPVHIAVEKKNEEMLDYLLNCPDIKVNVETYLGLTPLHLAVESGDFNFSNKLIVASADVNYTTFKCPPPLACSVSHPKITKLLIDNGADIDLRSHTGDTALHFAVKSGNLEAVCLLLCHGADANIPSIRGNTPFMVAIEMQNVEIQEALINYVTDFDVVNENDRSIMQMALYNSSPFWESILDGGAVITDKELIGQGDLYKFTRLWNKLERIDSPLYTLFSELSGIDNENFVKHVEMLMEAEKAFGLYVETSNICFNIYIFKNRGLNDLYTKFVLAYLMHGYKLTFSDIQYMFRVFGNGELYQILRYMQYENTINRYGDDKSRVTLSLFLNVRYDIQNINIIRSSYGVSQWDEIVLDLEACFEYFSYHYLTEVYLSYFDEDPPYNGQNVIKDVPKVPLLLELARNKARRYIIKKFNIKNSSQYYTIIDYFSIPHVLKRVLKFDIPLYNLQEKVKNW